MLRVIWYFDFNVIIYVRVDVYLFVIFKVLYIIFVVLCVIDMIGKWLL